jgi:hypothetical protein
VASQDWDPTGAINVRGAWRVARASGARSWKLEAGSWELEAGSWKLGAVTEGFVFANAFLKNVCIMFA